MVWTLLNHSFEHFVRSFSCLNIHFISFLYVSLSLYLCVCICSQERSQETLPPWPWRWRKEKVALGQEEKRRKTLARTWYERCSICSSSLYQKFCELSSHATFPTLNSIHILFSINIWLFLQVEKRRNIMKRRSTIGTRTKERRTRRSIMKTRKGRIITGTRNITINIMKRNMRRRNMDMNTNIRSTKKNITDLSHGPVLILPFFVFPFPVFDTCPLCLSSVCLSIVPHYYPLDTNNSCCSSQVISH